MEGGRKTGRTRHTCKAGYMFGDENLWETAGWEVPFLGQLAREMASNGIEVAACGRLLVYWICLGQMRLLFM
jgi:hypothetical protein